jgi:hypothetical protein
VICFLADYTPAIAAFSQEYVVKLPDRIRKLAERAQGKSWVDAWAFAVCATALRRNAPRQLAEGILQGLVYIPVSLQLARRRV